MKAKRISQREARKMRAELNRIKEHQRRTWGKDWPDGTVIGSTAVHEVTREQVRVARILGHAVVVTLDNDRMYFHAVPLAGEK